MICNTCGRVIKNEEANFCEYCGASVRGRNGFDMSSSPIPPVTDAVTVDHKEKPVSFLNWLGTCLLVFIPYVGSFLFLIMLFVWAFGHNVPESKKNWARANLVIMLILLVISIIIINAVGIDQIINMIFGDMSQYYNIY